jgi:exodeoxyribonuclease VII small subunit
MDDHTQYPNQNIDDLSFEETYSLLTESIKQLEEGGLTLSEATQLYLSGISLANHASEMLSKAELQIKTLSQPELVDQNHDDED